MCHVCLFVCALKAKRLELSTPNWAHVYSIAVDLHALTQKSKGQRSSSHRYKNSHGRTVASDHVPYCVTYTPLCYLRPLPAWVCMSIRLPMFSSYLLCCCLVQIFCYIISVVQTDKIKTDYAVYKVAQWHFSGVMDKITTAYAGQIFSNL